MCNLTYKTITKLIVDRLRPLLPELIHPAQITFITNRNIVDNVIIAYEIVHTMRAMGAKKGWKVVKIHLEKAYDKLKWKFVEDTLGDRRFLSASHFK